MHATIWTSILTPIGIALTFALFRRAFPVRGADSSSEPLTDDERRECRRWEIASSLVWLLLSVACGIASYLILTRMAGWLRPESPDTVFLVEPTPVFWAVPAIFLGMLTAIIPLDLGQRALLRDRYRRFERYGNERLGFDSNRVFLVLLAFGLVGASLFFLAGATSFARFTRDGIEIGRPFSFRSRFYEYWRIEGIEHRATYQAPAGNTLERPHYVILFDDGSSWSTREGCRDPVPRVDDPILKYVSSRTGKAIVPRP